MNYNYNEIQAITEDAGLLYTMIGELTEGIARLPGCKMTARLKDASKNVATVSNSIYSTIRNIAAEAEALCEEYEDGCEDSADEYGEADIPTGSDLQELLDRIAEIFASGKPVSISADIYINEGKDSESEV